MRSEEETLFTSFLHMISHILNAYLTAFVVFTGISLNLFSIYVFLRCERSSAPAIQYYLVTLTIWQTALLANAFLLYSFPHILFGHLVSQDNDYQRTIVTEDEDRVRVRCGCAATRGNRIKIVPVNRVKRLMVIVSLLAVLFSSPRFFEVHVVQFCNKYNECVAVIDRTALFEVSAILVPITVIHC
ncbi:unnamed protein product [Haemonchus placei]|uniref:G_PROTEIN_RECEP_F1_2 domain-containing protein n=1 Tax=Haemonchus placei TaxID=6290 RepID=A0A0N4WXQ1_HAEPC|nr:unnamed protein product [Haemonchus placei]